MPLTIQSDSALVPASSVDQPRALYARRILVEAIFLGGLADALLHNGFGLGLAIWMAVFAALLGRLVAKRGDGMRGFFFQAEDGIRVLYVTGVQTCALPI